MADQTARGSTELPLPIRAPSVLQAKLTSCRLTFMQSEQVQRRAAAYEDTKCSRSGDYSFTCARMVEALATGPGWCAWISQMACACRRRFASLSASILAWKLRAVTTAHWSPGSFAAFAGGSRSP